MAKPSRKNKRAPRPTITRRPSSASTNAAEATPAPEAAPEATPAFADMPDMAGPAHEADRATFLFERRLKPGRYQPFTNRATKNQVSKPSSARSAKILAYVEQIQDRMREKEWEILDARWAEFEKNLSEHEKDLAQGGEEYHNYLAGREESERIVDEKVRQTLEGVEPDSVLDGTVDRLEIE